MADFMVKMMSARKILKKEKTKEEIAKELDVAVCTVEGWVRAVKSAAINEHLRMEAVATKKERPEKKTSKPKPEKLPEPAAEAPTPTKPTTAPPVTRTEEDVEDDEWDLI